MKKYAAGMLVLLATLVLSGCFTSQKKVQSAPLVEVIAFDDKQSNAQEEAKNIVVSFFWNVELRYITDTQLDEIVRALNDLSILPANELKNKRYADFYGGANEWSLLQLIYAYFVPEKEVSLEGFYEDVEKPESRQIVLQTLSDIETYKRGDSQALTDAESPTKW